MTKVIITTLLFLSFSKVFCEYRVYQYQVQSRTPSSTEVGPYLITSTLNPLSYQAYHGGFDSLKVDLLRTWMCYGDTSKKEYCRPPLDIATQDQEVKSTLNKGLNNGS